MNDRQRTSSSLNAMVPAAVLILVGVIFLLRNLHIVDLGHRWWALFLLVPLVYLGSRIMEQRTRHGGSIPPAARGMLTGFLSIGLVMVIFLLDLDWGDVWPLFIILAGVSFLVGRSGDPPGRDTAPGDGEAP